MLVSLTRVDSSAMDTQSTSHAVVAQAVPNQSSILNLPSVTAAYQFGVRTAIGQSRLAPGAKVSVGRVSKTHPSKDQRRRFMIRNSKQKLISSLVLQIERMTVDKEEQLSQDTLEFDVEQIHRTVLQHMSDLSL